jgi:hypothetical protein
MGGIVARQVFLLPQFQPGTIKDVITLATPHKEAPVPLYRSMISLYTTLNSYWNENHRPGRKLENVTLVSIGGGTRDTTLDSELTEIHEISHSSLSLHLYSSGTPHIWSSADHESAVWCDQILEAIGFATYELYEAKNQSVHSRMNILNKIFSSNLIRKPDKTFSNREILVTAEGNQLQLPIIKTIDFESRFHRLWLPSIQESSIFSLRLLTNFSQSDIGIYRCESENLFTNCKSIEEKIVTLPFPYKPDHPIVFKSPMTPPNQGRKEWLSIEVPALSLENATSVGFEVLPNSNGFLFLEVQSIKGNLRIYDSLTTQYLLRSWDFVKTKSLLTTLRFPSFNDRFVKYKFYFRVVDDFQPAFTPIILQKLANEAKPLYSKRNNVITFYPSRHHPDNKGLELQVWLDPSMKGFEFFMTMDIFGTFGSVITQHKFMLISLAMSIIFFLFMLILSGKCKSN